MKKKIKFYYESICGRILTFRKRVVILNNIVTCSIVLIVIKLVLFITFLLSYTPSKKGPLLKMRGSIVYSILNIEYSFVLIEINFQIYFLNFL